ncbi:MAG: iron-sulfur cluster biosynthesis transcriptional regulator SufR [Cyanobacteria bacterium P01_F01_bin.42]
MATTGYSKKQQILDHLLRGQATAGDLASALSVSPQAIRRHLKDLEADGLIEFESTHEGMGRPQHRYQLSRKGRSRFPDRYDEFALDLIDSLFETVGPDQTQTILKKQWERKALEYRKKLGQGTLADRVQGLVQLRQQEGYMSECYPQPVDIDPSEAKRFVLTEYNCTISQVAESFPKVCDHELEMFALALADCLVERTHWIVNGEHRCGYLIQAK